MHHRLTVMGEASLPSAGAGRRRAGRESGGATAGAVHGAALLANCLARRRAFLTYRDLKSGSCCRSWLLADEGVTCGMTSRA
jgi:hypothetical protein